MTACEICGVSGESLAVIEIDGAALNACSNCTGMGVVIETADGDDEEDDESPEEKSSFDTQIGFSGTGAQASSLEEPKNSPSNFEQDVEELVYDYDERLRKTRQQADLSRKELAETINEKTSYIERLERGKALPSEKARRKLETELDIELTSKGGH
jgi:uncharacterized protein (TIGR00270 family)